MNTEERERVAIRLYASCGNGPGAAPSLSADFQWPLISEDARNWWRNMAETAVVAHDSALAAALEAAMTRAALLERVAEAAANLGFISLRHSGDCPCVPCGAARRELRAQLAALDAASGTEAQA